MTSDSRDGLALRIGSTVQRTEAEGPGPRFAVWAQGCSIRCPGCFNPHLWGAKGGRVVDVDDLAQDVMRAAERDSIEGITLLGGEPFDQAAGFAELATKVRRAGLSVMVFSGYELTTLEGPNAPESAGTLLAETDILVDGPYRAESPDFARPWVGSTNQNFHFLTDRYRHLAARLTSFHDRVEIRVGMDGSVAINGWAPVDQLDNLLAGVTPLAGRGRDR
ncbi:4Fe-4S single cluster domain-containing protein [Isoptericola sp. NPDC056618]|uniref:4Fe-4S single cluster domain-containing protein n=1 Tax=Isoptericola sp. NPDC056618 TaxID=3345878 RepID=UPI0036ADADE4